VTICPLGDIQWAGDEEDLAYNHLSAHLDNCLRHPTPLFMGMGDYIDFASPSNRERLKQARLYDTAQKVIADATKSLVDDLYERLLKPTKAKWLELMQGHHHHPVILGKSRRGEELVTDSDVYLAEKLEAKFGDEFGFTRLTWPGGGTFHIVAYHGKGSSVFPWGPLNQLWRLVPNFHADLLLMGHQCLPVRSKILTSRGFKHHSELLLGESVLAYDLETKTCKWTPLQDITVYPSAPLVQVHSKSFHAEMTPDHQLVVRRLNGTEYISTLEQAKYYEALVTAAPAEAGQSDVSVRDAAILGWLVTDGNMGWTEIKGKKYPNFQIGQKKKQYVTELTGLLGNDATLHSEESGMVYFYLRAPLAYRLLKILSSKAALPALVTTLSREARQEMFQVMMRAEGNGVRTFSQNPGPVWEAFLILAVLEGRRCGLRQVKGPGFKPNTFTWETRVLSRHAGPPSVSYLAVAPIEPGAVWCPTTKYGTWVTEQDGLVFITGNTKKAMAETDRLLFPDRGSKLAHMTVKIVGTGGWTKGYVAGRRTYVSEGGLSPVALGQPLIHLRPRMIEGRWDAGMTVEL